MITTTHACFVVTLALGVSLAESAAQEPRAKPPVKPQPAAERAANPQADASARQGVEVLLSTARFFASQPSAWCQVKLRTEEQGTMGWIHNTATAEFAFAGPNRFVFDCDQLAEGDVNRGYRYLVRCDGKYLMRCEWDRFCLAEAPTNFRDMARSPLLVTRDPWRPDLKRWILLLDPESVKRLVASSQVSYRGTTQVGGVDAHCVRLSADTEGERAFLGYKWDLYIAKGERPVLLRIKVYFDRLFPSLVGRDRPSDSYLAFRSWSFAGPKAEAALRPSIPDGAQLVAGPGPLFDRNDDAANPMAGKPLPKFRANDASGAVINSAALLGEGPLVLIFWDARYTSLRYLWEKLGKYKPQYANKGVRFVAVQVGPEARAKVRKYVSELDDPPEILDGMQGKGPFEKGTESTYLWNPLKPTDFQLGDLVQTYLVSRDGLVQRVDTGLIQDPKQQFLPALEAVLEGRNWFQEDLAAREKTRKQLDHLLTKFRDHVAAADAGG